MSILAYLWGVAVLGSSVWLLALGAGAVTRAALPDWRGPVRLLGGIAVALCWIYAVSYGLGAAGWFRPLPLFGLIDAGALAAWWWLSGRRTRPERFEPIEPAPVLGAGTPKTGAGSLLAAVGVALVVAAWLPGTVHAYRYGILEPDSVWYHGHFSARFVQTGWLTRMNPVGVDALVPFHLANRELLDAVLDLPWQRDILLPLTNLLYLGLALLAGWCIGSRWQRGPLAMLAVAMIASAPVMILSHPGSLKNDLFGGALLLTAMAVFVHSRERLPAIGLAAAMLGLAAGTKSNLLVLVLVTLLLGAVLLAVQTRSWKAPAVWLAGTALFGTFWYIRNWVRAGNPLPWIDIDLGPLHLSQVDPADGTDTYSTQTLVQNFDHPRLVDGVIRPGLRAAFGDVWWWWAIMFTACLALVATRRRERWLWVMAATGTAGLLAHLVTPLSLVVPPDNPGAAFNFAFNTRYFLPAAALLLVAGACATRTGWQELVFAGAAVAVIISGLFPTILSFEVSHDAERADAPLAIALGVAVVALGVWLVVSRRMGLAAALVPAVVIAAAGLPLADHYLERRYETPMPKLASRLWPTTSDMQDARIGVATDPKPYPSDGDDLSNRVDYIGIEAPGEVLRNATSCEEWVERVAELDLTHVALAPEPFVLVLSGATMEAWTLTIPGAEVVERQGDQVLIELPGQIRPSPEACAAVPSQP